MNVNVESVGAGPGLVMLHGWGMHGGVWGAVRCELAENFRLHLVDLPGYGSSPACEPYTMGQIVQHLLPVLPERANICGWSLGGQLALYLAQRFPDKVARLALVATTPRFTACDDWSLGIAPSVLEEFAGSLARDYAGTLKRFLSLQVRGSDSGRRALAQLRGRLFERGQPSQSALQAGLRLLLRTDLRARVKSVFQPALIIHGEQDTLAAAGAGQWLAGNLPHAKLLLLSGCAHAPFLSHPEKFVAALRGFFFDER